MRLLELADRVIRALPALPTRWNTAEASQTVQHAVYYGLSAAYGLIAFVALVQLIRIQLRVPEYGWTTQKLFHLLNCLVLGVRSATFALYSTVDKLPGDSMNPTQNGNLFAWLVIVDLPGLLFLTTYTLLVLFWAEIYHQARSIPLNSLRPVFAILNVAVYAVQASLWAVRAWVTQDPGMLQVGQVGSSAFLALVCLAAALGFLLYGGRLFLMLQRFPIESRGRRKKLREVGLVTSICAGCFALRAVMVAVSVQDFHGADTATSPELALDVLKHPLPNLIYYSLVEVLPSACVLYILRKLPPPRSAQGYQQIPTQ